MLRKPFLRKIGCDEDICNWLRDDGWVDGWLLSRDVSDFMGLGLEALSVGLCFALRGKNC